MINLIRTSCTLSTRALRRAGVHRRSLLLFVLTTLFLGSGCEMQVDHAPKDFPKPATQVVEPVDEVAQPLTEFMDRRSVTYGDGRMVDFLVIKIDEKEFDWGMANNPNDPKTVLAWRQELNANLVINGSYFDENMQPTGYYHAAGATSTRFDWPGRDEQTNETGYTGLVRIIDGDLKLSYLPAGRQRESAPDVAAFLSFPTLLYDGEALIETDSKKYAHRTLLAQDVRGSSYIILTESGIPSLYETAVWLEAQPEEFAIAINLDGGNSTGLSYADDEVKVEVISAAVPNVIYLNHQ
ncbi:hypothetical protein GF391_03155 [Candidatus Uhrbacteria bacterium]|nr:hypothetical protein [Candidatus Uhrbacteria bacterium]